jgi:hypothetical protein
MRGKSVAEAEAEMAATEMEEDDIAALLPHRVFPGNRPSSTLLLEEITPRSLGMLIALYELSLCPGQSGDQLLRSMGVELKSSSPAPSSPSW